MKLKEIIETKVCSYCGGELAIAQLEKVDTIVCRPCSRRATAVSPEIYKLASDFVRDHPYGYFRAGSIDGINCEAFRNQVNIDKICSVITWLNRQKEATLEVDDDKVESCS